MTNPPSFLPGLKVNPALRMALALALLTSFSASAQITVFDDAASWARTRILGFKEQESKRPTNLHQFIVGHWQDKAQLVTGSATAPASGSDPFGYSWIGEISGSIDSAGNMRFSMGNGCRFEGQATTFASDSTWAVEGILDNCPLKPLNRKVFGRLVTKQNRLYFGFAEPMINPDPKIKIKFVTTLLARV